jgi:hypothetical protein
MNGTFPFRFVGVDLDPDLKLLEVVAIKVSSLPLNQLESKRKLKGEKTKNRTRVMLTVTQ